MEGLVNMDLNFFDDKTVFITGHTGFKGSWLCKVLERTRAKVIGYSLNPPTEPNLFSLANISDNIIHIVGDIRDFSKLHEIIKFYKPDIVLHLAAQPIVRDSYKDPKYTYETNVMGTVNILESIRQNKCVKSFLNVTTDKVYLNKEWVWGYRENDSLGGHDPYSASKACAEIAIKSYKKSFFQDLNIVSARAGNVIGGGDFADNRIIPDIVRAIEKNTYVELRNPHSVRPWQHVLDVLYGYILLAYSMINNKNISESYNFAPIDEGDKFTVEYITKAFIDNIGKGSYIINSSETSKKEMNMLRLDSSLARKELNWKEKFNTEEAIKQTAIWYKEYLNKNNINNITEIQIKKIIEEG